MNEDAVSKLYEIAESIRELAARNDPNLILKLYPKYRMKMEWIDFEEKKPEKKGYYLCSVWSGIGDHYGAYTKHEVNYFDGQVFNGYPMIHWDNEGALRAFVKVTWYCEIPHPPMNPGHYVLPEREDK